VGVLLAPREASLSKPFTRVRRLAVATGVKVMGTEMNKTGGGRRGTEAQSI